jgi:anti-sigma factor RsiW
MTGRRNEMSEMRHDRTAELSAWLDGELSPDEVVALERRLEEEPELARLAAELASIRSAAAQLDVTGPARDLWPEIAEQIRAKPVAGRTRERGRRTFSFTVPQLAAAAVTLLALGSGAMWTVRQAGGGAGDTRASSVDGADTAGSDVRIAASSEALPTARIPDDAIADLERRLVEERGGLDSSTVRVLEESLATIDRAIEQASQALALDPGNAWLTRHLAGAKARKVRLLERANALATPRT